MVILDGPRGVGKTTTAARVVASSVYLPHDLELLRVDPVDFLRALAEPVLIDEWQLAGTELLWAIKRVVDDDPRPGRFVLTGSVEPASYGPTHPLTGRAARLVMRPMTAAELDGSGAASTLLARVIAGELPAVGSRVAPELDLGELLRAGFPAARELADPRTFLEAYAALISHRAGEEGRDSSRFLRTMRVLATLTGQAVPDQRIWAAADINKVTWKLYDDLLIRVHLSANVSSFESNRLKRLTAYPKRFLCDTAMALVLADLDVGRLSADPSLAGRYVESFVAQQLRPQVDEVGGSLFHLRTAGGEREIDCVIETRRGLLAMEVKHAHRPTRADARALDWLRNEAGPSFVQGFVVHTGTDCYPLGEHILALPVTMLTR